jgi:D-3-phosphoglycerate dehydrogenase / 2-oxoglutarate reductase
MTMRIVLCSPLDAAAVERLSERHHVVAAAGVSREELLAAVVGADVLVVRSGVSIDRDLLDRASAVRLVIRAGSGIDNVDVDTLVERGIALERVPGLSAEAVAELTIALVLAVLRNLTEADRTVRAGQWRKHALTGHRAAGRTLGIVGAGAIGTRVGQLGAALGMAPLGCVAWLTPEARARLSAAGIEPATFDQVLELSDIVTVHTPLTPETRGLIDDAALRRMRPGSYLITAARGGVLDEWAVRAALLDGHLAGAALDVHEHEGDGMRSPLAELPNVVLTPHIGAGTYEAQRAIGDRVIELVDALQPAAPEAEVRS